MSRSRFPSMGHLWVAAALSAILLIALLKPAPPNDLWWQVAMGREIVRTGAVPTVDTFSWTRTGAPFYDQPWLAQITMYSLQERGGIALLRAFHALLVLTAYVLVLRACWIRSGRLRAGAFLLILSIPVSAESWVPRSENFGLLLLAAFLLVLTRWKEADRVAKPFARAGPPTGETASVGLRIVGLGGPPSIRRPDARLWPLPVLMAIWVNVHGSFVLGGLLVVLFGLGTLVDLWIEGRRATPGGDGYRTRVRRKLGPLLFWGLLAAVAVLLNPRGPGVLGYVFGMASDPLVTQWITEWAPPSPLSPAGAFFFLYAGLVVGAALVGRGRREVVDLLLVGTFLILALSAMRHVVWFPIVTLPFLASRVAALAPPRARRARSPGPAARAANWVVLAMLGAAVAVAVPWLRPWPEWAPARAELLSRDTPEAAVDALRRDPEPPRHLFHSIGTGSYLMWADPGQPVFVDARIELYPLEQWEAYGMLNRGEAVDSLVATYGIDGMLLDNESQRALLDALAARPGWRLRYEDPVATYLVRSPSVTPTPSSGASRRRASP